MTIAVVTVVVVTFFSKNNLTPPKPMRFLRAAFCNLAMFYSEFFLVNIFYVMLIEETQLKKVQIFFFLMNRGQFLVYNTTRHNLCDPLKL